MGGLGAPEAKYNHTWNFARPGIKPRTFGVAVQCAT